MRLVDRRGLRRGVLILPSLFTLGNLFCGFCAVMEAAKARFQDEAMGDPETHFVRAAAFILIAIILDGLDGKVARLAHATSPMGIQLDSLADVVSFGVAPGLLAYTWALIDLPRFGWGVAFVFTSCGALRLARFNVQAATPHDQRYFVGLPIPGAAGSIAALVYAQPAPTPGLALPIAFAAWTLLVALLMVSTIRYRSMKEVDLSRRRPLRVLVWIVLTMALLRSFPEIVLALATTLYALSGPVARLVGTLRRGERRPDSATSEHEPVEAP